MALSTFSELKTEIANYVDRSDLTDQIPTFIKLAEAPKHIDIRNALVGSIDPTVPND